MSGNVPSAEHAFADAPLLSAQYEVLSLLGEGGMGRVYKAEHRITGQEVAIKALHQELSSDETFRARFVTEAKVLSRLDHPSITHLLNFIEESDGRLFLIMQYVAGSPLEDLIMKVGPLPAAVSMTIMHEVLAAFDYAHTRGIIHRDIKPSNIVLPPTGGVKVMDFGIARMESGVKLTTTGASLGSPAYMSPEQVTGAHLDARCDIYALGVLLFEMMTGDIPFPGDNGYTVMKAHVEEDPPDPRDLIHMPDAIADAILWALAKEPEERPSRASELARVLPTAADLGGSNLASWQYVNEEHGGAAEGESQRGRATVPDIHPSKAMTAVRGSSRQDGSSSWSGTGSSEGGSTGPTSDGGSSGGPTRSESPSHRPVTPTFASESRAGESHDKKGPINVYGPGDPPRSSPAAALLLTVLLIGTAVFLLYKIFIARDTEVAQSVPPPPGLADFTPRIMKGQEMVPVPATSGLDGFFIDRTEVTYRRYRAFLDDCPVGSNCGPSALPPALRLPEEEAHQILNHPVGNVSQVDARAFCAWADKRLPTSREWTRVASGDQKLTYPWGNDPSGADDIWIAMPNKRGSKKFYEELRELPGQLPTISVYDPRYYADKGPFGVMGLGGNLAEWLADADPDDDALRLTAGGSWSSYNVKEEARAGDRLSKNASWASPSVGFRCVIDVPNGLKKGKPSRYVTIKKNKVIRFGAEEECPPLYFTQDSKPVGLEYSLMKAIAKHLDVKLELAHYMYPDLPARVRSGHIDVLLSAYTPDNGIRGIDWSIPYLEYGLCLGVRSDSSIKSMADIKGKVVGHYNDPATAKVVAKLATEAKKIAVYENRYYEDLEAGRIDAFLYDFPLAQEEMKRFGGKLRIAEFGLTESTYNAGLPEGEWSLIRDVNDAIRIWLDSEESAEAVRRYLGGATPVTDIPPGARSALIQKGDTLRTVATRELGDEKRWREIWDLNRSRLGNKSLLTPGNRLVLPEK